MLLFYELTSSNGHLGRIRIDSGMSTSMGYSKHKFVRIPVAAFYINTSPVWVRVTC